jgi:hypothetical protein
MCKKLCENCKEGAILPEILQECDRIGLEWRCAYWQHKKIEEHLKSANAGSSITYKIETNE